MKDEHIIGDHLEEYAMGRLPEGDLSARIEEHLLVCKTCQDELVLLDELLAGLSLYEKAHRGHGSGESGT
jgi:hypothetical protein